jgi:NADH-quinone oxidoreductase subunit J
MDQALMYVAFFALAGLTLLAGLAVVALKNIFHSALALVVTFIGVAGIYFMLQAPFLAVVQVLIYVGAITVLIIFAIMLTRRLMDQHLVQFTGKWWIAAPLAVVLFGLVGFVAYSTTWLLRPNEALPADAVAALGTELMTTYLLPFEIASVLLLVALVGAIVVAWPIKDRLPVVEELEEKIAEAKKRALGGDDQVAGIE